MTKWLVCVALALTGLGCSSVPESAPTAMPAVVPADERGEWDLVLFSDSSG